VFERGLAIDQQDLQSVTRQQARALQAGQTGSDHDDVDVSHQVRCVSSEIWISGIGSCGGAAQLCGTKPMRKKFSTNCRF
jgi:hypothetical protein